MEDRRTGETKGQNQRGLYDFDSVHAPVLRFSMSKFIFFRQLLKTPVRLADSFSNLPQRPLEQLNHHSVTQLR